MDEGHEGTEGIPIARVRVEIAWTYLPAVGAVVEYLALGADLIEATGEEQGSIETAVEGLHTLLGVGDSDTTQLPLPYLLPLGSYLGVGAVGDLLKVGQCLLGADERGGDIEGRRRLLALAEIYGEEGMLPPFAPPYLSDD